MSQDVEALLSKRQVLLAAVDAIAAPLADEGRDSFVRQAVARINRAYPAPSQARMRDYLSRSIG